MIIKKNDCSLISDSALVNFPILNARACVCFSVKLTLLFVIVLGQKIIFYDLIVSLLIQVNKIHHGEDEMPQVSFFTGRSKASCSATSTATSSSTVSGAEEKV